MHMCTGCVGCSYNSKYKLFHVAVPVAEAKQNQGEFKELWKNVVVFFLFQVQSCLYLLWDKNRNLLNHVPTVCLYSLWSSLFGSLSFLCSCAELKNKKRRARARCLFRTKTMRKENRGPRPLVQTEDSAVRVSLTLWRKYKQRCQEEALDLNVSKCDAKEQQPL